MLVNIIVRLSPKFTSISTPVILCFAANIDS